MDKDRKIGLAVLSVISIATQYAVAGLRAFVFPGLKESWIWFYPFGVHVAILASLPAAILVWLALRDKEEDVRDICTVFAFGIPALAYGAWIFSC